MSRRVRRRAVVAGVSSVLVAGCSGLRGGDSGDSGGNPEAADAGSGGDDATGQNATPEAVSCSELASAQLVSYDVGGTAFPCTVAYPEPLGLASELGDPTIAVQFQAPVGAGSVLVNAQITDRDDGYTEAQVTDIYPEAESFEYGDSTGYLVTITEPSADIPRAQFSVEIPFDSGDGSGYYGVTFAAQYGMESNDREYSTGCLTAIDEIARTVAESVAPNPDTEFGSTIDGG